MHDFLESAQRNHENSSAGVACGIWISSVFCYLKAYKQTKARGGNDWTLLNAYFMGVGSGYGYANIELRAKNESPFFCVPKNLALDAQNYIDILDAEIERGKFTDDITADYILLVGLRFTFPCK